MLFFTMLSGYEKPDPALGGSELCFPEEEEVQRTAHPPSAFRAMCSAHTLLRGR